MEKYVALLLRGVVNPVVTGNVFKGCEYYPIRVVLRDSASVSGAVKAGYGDTISSFSDENQNAMRKNTPPACQLLQKRFFLYF